MKLEFDKGHACNGKFEVKDQLVKMYIHNLFQSVSQNNEFKKAKWNYKMILVL